MNSNFSEFLENSDDEDDGSSFFDKAAMWMAEKLGDEEEELELKFLKFSDLTKENSYRKKKWDWLVIRTCEVTKDFFTTEEEKKELLIRMEQNDDMGLLMKYFLPVKKGEKLTIVEEAGTRFFMVKNSKGENGVVPKEYVGKVSYLNFEKYLKSVNKMSCVPLDTRIKSISLKKTRKDLRKEKNALVSLVALGKMKGRKMGVGDNVDFGANVLFSTEEDAHWYVNFITDTKEEFTIRVDIVIDKNTNVPEIKVRAGKKRIYDIDEYVELVLLAGKLFPIYRELPAKDGLTVRDVLMSILEYRCCDIGYTTTKGSCQVIAKYLIASCGRFFSIDLSRIFISNFKNFPSNQVENLLIKECSFSKSINPGQKEGYEASYVRGCYKIFDSVSDKLTGYLDFDMNNNKSRDFGFLENIKGKDNKLRGFDLIFAVFPSLKTLISFSCVLMDYNIERRVERSSKVTETNGLEKLMILDRSFVTHDGLKMILERFPKLQQLVIQKSLITKIKLKRFSENSSLTFLDLSGNEIQKEGFTNLLKILKSLKTVIVVGCKIKKFKKKEKKKFPIHSDLSRLDISGNLVKEEDVAFLFEKFPKIEEIVCNDNDKLKFYGLGTYKDRQERMNSEIFECVRMESWDENVILRCIDNEGTKSLNYVEFSNIIRRIDTNERKELITQWMVENSVFDLNDTVVSFSIVDDKSNDKNDIEKSEEDEKKKEELMGDLLFDGNNEFSECCILYRTIRGRRLLAKLVYDEVLKIPTLDLKTVDETIESQLEFTSVKEYPSIEDYTVKELMYRCFDYLYLCTDKNRLFHESGCFVKFMFIVSSKSFVIRRGFINMFGMQYYPENKVANLHLSYKCSFSLESSEGDQGWLVNFVGYHGERASHWAIKKMINQINKGLEGNETIEEGVKGFYEIFPFIKKDIGTYGLVYYRGFDVLLLTHPHLKMVQIDFRIKDYHLNPKRCEIPSSPLLETLVLSNSRISSKGFSIVLRRFENLRSLVLRGKGIKKINIKNFVNNSMTYMDISGNQIGFEGFNAVVSNFKGLNNLVVIKCGIDMCKSKEADKFPEHEHLKMVDLSLNNICKSNVRFLRKKCPKLEEIIGLRNCTFYNYSTLPEIHEHSDGDEEEGESDNEDNASDKPSFQVLNDRNEVRMIFEDSFTSFKREIELSELFNRLVGVQARESIILKITKSLIDENSKCSMNEKFIRVSVKEKVKEEVEGEGEEVNERVHSKSKDNKLIILKGWKDMSSYYIDFESEEGNILRVHLDIVRPGVPLVRIVYGPLQEEKVGKSVEVFEMDPKEVTGYATIDTLRFHVIIGNVIEFLSACCERSEFMCNHEAFVKFIVSSSSKSFSFANVGMSIQQFMDFPQNLIEQLSLHCCSFQIVGEGASQSVEENTSFGNSLILGAERFGNYWAKKYLKISPEGYVGMERMYFPFLNGECVPFFRGLDIFAMAFRNLRTLRMHDCYVRDYHLNLKRSVNPELPLLEKLIIQKTLLTCKGLGRLIERCPNLKHLVFQEGHLKKLTLKENWSIVNADFSSTFIEKAEFMEIIKKMKALKNLKLKLCEITEFDENEKNSFPEHSMIVDIDLFGNPIAEKEEETQFLFEKCSSLQMVGTREDVDVDYSLMPILYKMEEC